jgi:hypothetical protein
LELISLEGGDDTGKATSVDSESAPAEV